MHTFASYLLLLADDHRLQSYMTCSAHGFIITAGSETTDLQDHDGTASPGRALSYAGCSE